MASVTVTKSCASCGGSGSLTRVCGLCGGSGQHLIATTTSSPCTACGGAGGYSDAGGWRYCPSCGGSGKRTEPAEYSQACSGCGGSGRDTQQCSACNGSGRVQVQEYLPEPPTISAATLEQTRPDPWEDLRQAALREQREHDGQLALQRRTEEYLEEQRTRDELGFEVQSWHDWDVNARLREAHERDRHAHDI